MKKFTDKQIETFMSAINNGILEYMNDNYMIDNLDKVSDKLSKVDEGRYILFNITRGQIIHEFDARGEKETLITDLLESHDAKKVGKILTALSNTYSGLIPKKEVTRKTMTDLLGLRDFATKEEILKEFNEIL